MFKNAGLHNVADTRQTDEGLRISRLPYRLLPSLNETARLRAERGACSELRFNLKGEAAVLTMQTEEEPGILEIYNGPFLHSWHIIGTQPTTITITPPERQPDIHQASLSQRLPFDPLLYRLILPWKWISVLHDLTGDIAPPRIGQVPPVRYLAYGSSITNGAAATRPTGMWAMRTAQNLGVDLINLGLGGSAHCEPQLADYIAGRRDWNFATLELGINMVNWASLEEFENRATYFVNAIAKAHPEKFIFCLDMFPFWRDLDPDDTKPLEYREAVRRIVEDIQSPYVIHIDARSLLPGWDNLTSDMIHPSPAGMEIIAANLTPIIQKHIANLLHR